MGIVNHDLVVGNRTGQIPETGSFELDDVIGFDKPFKQSRVSWMKRHEKIVGEGFIRKQEGKNKRVWDDA